MVVGPCIYFTTGCYLPCLRGKNVWVQISIEKVSVYLLPFLPRKSEAQTKITDLIWFICLNSGIRQSLSSIPEYTKLQHTKQVQATKLNTYNLQWQPYNYNIHFKYLQRLWRKNNKSLKSCCGSEFHHVMAFCWKWRFESANLHQTIIAKFTGHLVLWAWWRPNWMGGLKIPWHV